ncbi:MAG: TIGR00299 family protein [Desulfotalea sp.]|nr:MAG: TIGR00299 family protein [Desulfotalea sp.]
MTYKTAYMDCFSGISGDMLLGALLHCDLDKDYLLTELKKLQIPGLKFSASDHKDCSINSCKVVVDQSKRQDLRTFSTIKALLENSALSPTVISRSLHIFNLLAKAEAKVHGIDLEEVHFHEVGALDTIVDIVGAVIGFEHLGITRIICSPLPSGHGFIHCDHGRLPLPAPAVCELLKGVPTYGVDLAQELVTPTGAALVRGLSDGYGPLPAMTVETTGYGAGSQSLTNGQPNLLRLLIGTEQVVAEKQDVEIIETNLDDWRSEGFPYLCELLFSQGALDVTLTPILMKKGRPGYTLQVISSPAYRQQIQEIIFSETSAIGLRFRTESRRTLKRKQISVETPWGQVMAKEVTGTGRISVYPEYEECRKIAVTHKIPLQEVYHKVQTYKDVQR